ncbi:MAG: DedA family protein [Vulcanimicrobiaceae bacterium]|jgi:membrane protein DedA with SNARE-associated domain
MEHYQSLILGLIHAYGYAGLFLVMLLGNVAIPVGAEVVLVVAGAAAGAGHLSSWVLVGTFATLGEIVGGIILYGIGYYGGAPVAHRFGRRAEHELARAHAFFEKFGARTIFICRFLPFIRGIAALPAGASRMPKRYFLMYHAFGSAIFCFALAYLGFAFGQHLDAILPAVQRSSRFILVIAILGVTSYLVMRRRFAARPGL